jgi:endonuclease/exonuclease/phosphatase family metal-dependent hydrolase
MARTRSRSSSTALAIHLAGTAIAAIALLAFGCNDATLTNNPPPTTNTPGADGGPGTQDGEAGGDASNDGPIVKGDGGTTAVRVVAANISSGAASTYDSGEGIRILKGLHPDVALIQEWNYGTGSATDLQKFVSDAFGAGYTYYREAEFPPPGGIPNGVVSRFPIAMSGHWNDPQLTNRGFAWAKITLPNSVHPLWAVSVHLLTSGAANRSTQATTLLNELTKVVQPGDYVVIGGDFNTDNRGEGCITTLSQVVSTSGPFPVDQGGNDFTNAPRTRPYDWVLTSPSLASLQVPTIFGDNVFPAGLVFDSRVYTPLSDVAPVMLDDSAAVNMQHMAVVRDFSVF